MKYLSSILLVNAMCVIASANGYVAHFYMSPTCEPWDLRKIWKTELQQAPGVSNVLIHTFLPYQGWADDSVFFESAPDVAQRLGDSLHCLKGDGIEEVKATGPELSQKRYACNQSCSFNQDSPATHEFGPVGEAPTEDSARQKALTSAPDFKKQCQTSGHGPHRASYSMDCVEQWAPLE